jgi:hypothetical protein
VQFVQDGALAAAQHQHQRGVGELRQADGVQMHRRAERQVNPASMNTASRPSPTAAIISLILSRVPNDRTCTELGVLEADGDVLGLASNRQSMANSAAS